MNKNFILVLFYLISLGGAAIAQTYGKYPNKFDFDFYMAKQVSANSVDSIHYKASQCISSFKLDFYKNVTVKTFYKQNGTNTTWKSLREFNDTNVVVFPQMPIGKNDFCVVANNKDTLLVLLASDKAQSTFHTLGFMSSGYLYIKDSIISICSMPINHTFLIFPSFDNKDCSDGLIASANSSTFTYMHNGLPRLNFLFNEGDLKDGDSLWYEYNQADILQSCQCMVPATVKKPLQVKSKKYYIKFEKSLLYKFPQNNIPVCPGDSIIIPSPIGTKEVEWYERYISASDNFMYHGLGKKNYSPKKVTQPNSSYYAKFFVPDIGVCPMLSDSIEFIEGTNCKFGQVNGIVYNDIDGNNWSTNNENLYQKILNVGPQNDIFAPSSEGFIYNFLVANGTKHYISLAPNDEFISDTVIVDFTNVNSYNEKFFVLKARLKRSDDTQVGLTSNRLRPGFKATVNIDVRNNGSTAKDCIVEVVLDTVFKDLQFTLPPISSTNNKYKWSKNQLPAFGNFRITATGTIPPNIDLLGKEAISYAKLTSADDPFLSNNYDTSRIIISGSYDPNDKQAFAENGNKITFIDEKKEIDYLIRFQNKGTDTAFTVVVIDTIKAGLDISTYKTLSSSHAYTYEIKNNKILIWTFKNILLPDDKVNEPGSHGYIKFRIGQSKGNVNGNFISNTAGIYFDFNPPVITNTETIRVGDYIKITGVEKTSKDETMLHLYPSPAKSSVQISGTPGTIQITDLQGKVLVEKLFSGNEVFDVENFASGIYFVKSTNGSQVVSEKLMIAK